MPLLPWLRSIPPLLVLVLVLIPSPALSEDKPPAALTADEKAKQLADLEKQIKELEAKREALKNAPVKTDTTPTAPEGTIPVDFMKNYSWRCVGPANMGGRVTALAVNDADPMNYWVATASGGLLKTTNNGTNFEFQFDNQATVSIGDVAVSASNPKIVWVGTGENNPRNSVSYGDGVYKSEDGGKTWKNMGLKKSFHIGKILIHPTNPEVVYVGALGRLYGPSEERGVFKTEDGGKTWKKSLFVNDKTGAQEMKMEPKDPNTIIAAMWERQRDEFDGFFGEPPSPDAYGPVVTHGAGSGLYKTTDGGKNWKKLSGADVKNGLPTAKIGRVGLDYSTKTKGLVFAIVDTENVGKGPPATPYLGVNTANQEGGGIKITGVTENSPAAKGGLKNDDIIIKYDNTKATDEDAFFDFFANKKIGDKLKLVVKRGDKEETLEITIAERPAPPPQVNPPTMGFRLAPGNALKIAALTKDGPAEKAGLKVDDEFVSVDGTDVKTTADFFATLGKKKEGDKVKVVVKRGTETKEVEVVLGPPNQPMGGGQPAVRPGPLLTRPFIASGVTGGQQANIQRRQGAEGHETGGVFMSKDGGDTWTRVNSLNPRPFYFSQIRVDPNDDKTIYVLGDVPTLWKSTNGGERFDRLASSNAVHADAHALWINPKDSRHMLIGCDGGFYVSYDKGAKWEHLNTLALGQFYHICVDNKKPYHVYGGLQDNGSWGGPSDTLKNRGPVNDDWLFVQGGDGFVCRVDPTDADLVYSESQGGAIARRNFRTGEGAGIRPQRKPTDEPLRYNWNTPFILSSHNSKIFYSGAQLVFRSVSKGDNQKPISPELTRTKKGSLTALAESPKNPEVLWAGSDDGFLWVTRDGGVKWDNVTANLQKAGLPGFKWVSTIETSKAEEGRAYVCLDAHRSDDDKPYLFVTEDFGVTWKPIATNLPAVGSSRTLREDIVNPNVLYCGTEFSAFISVNRGASWTKLGAGLPTVACHEFAQPTTANELVVGTHGRSIWIVDITPFRQMNADTFKNPATLFAPSVGIRWRVGGSGDFPYSAVEKKFVGTNPQRGVGLDYVLTKEAKEIKLSIQDASLKVVRDFTTVPRSVGMHRINWNLAGTSEAAPPGRRPVAGGVPPGTYTLVLTVDGKEFRKPLLVELDPNAAKDVISTENIVETLEAERKAAKPKMEPRDN